MLVNLNTHVRPVSFGQIKDKYKTDDIKARETIRGSLEPPIVPIDEDSYQVYLATKLRVEAQKKSKSKTTSIEETDKQKKLIEETNVDVGLLEAQKIYAFRERVKNKIYSGQRLTLKPEAIKALKEAGIKSVLCLVPFEEEYEKLALENGLNFIELKNIGNKTLRVRNFDVIEDILKRPELYAEGSKEVDDLKNFVDLVNGRDENFPAPLYMGCDWGTDRTFEWYTIAEILKDQPKDEPLTSERITRLSELIEIIKDSRRW